MNLRSWLFAAVFLTSVPVFAVSKKVVSRSQVGEVDGQGNIPYGKAGPTPRNVQEDYRGPPPDWKEGKVDVQIVPEPTHKVKNKK